MKPEQHRDGAARLASRTSRLRSSPIGSVLRLGGSPGIIPLAAGSPARELFPNAAVAEVTDRLLRDDPGALQYGDTAGVSELRAWVAAQDSARLGLTVRPEDVTLTHGSQQALDLICKALIDPGDVIVVDRPSYIGALQVFRTFEADLVPVPLADDARLDTLSGALRDGLRPRFLYVVSDFANPTGATLTLFQRRRLAELADHYGFYVVEDDPYGELRYDHDVALPALASLSDRVLRLESFSKVLFPAARLGHVRAPAELAPAIGMFKEAADLGNSSFLERIVLELVTRPGFTDDRAQEARLLYAERRDALVAGLRRHFGDQLDFAVPAGGFFVWARFSGATNADDLLAGALGHRVSFVPGSGFYAATPDHATLRLSFSGARPDELTEAALRLHRAWVESREGATR